VRRSGANLCSVERSFCAAFLCARLLPAGALRLDSDAAVTEVFDVEFVDGSEADSRSAAGLAGEFGPVEELVDQH
jgi:hypothetical protein